MAQRRPNQFQLDLDDDQCLSAWKSKIAARLGPAAGTPPQNENAAPSLKPAPAMSAQTGSPKDVNRRVTFEAPNEQPKSQLVPAIGSTARGSRDSRSSGMASSRYADSTAKRDLKETAMPSARLNTNPALAHIGKVEEGSPFTPTNLNATSEVPQDSDLSASAVKADSTSRRIAENLPTFNLAAREFHPRQPSSESTAAASQALMSPSSDGSSSVDPMGGHSRRTSSTQDRPGLSYQGLRSALSSSVYDDYDSRQSLLSRQAALDKRIQENQARRQLPHQSAMTASKERIEGHLQAPSDIMPYQDNQGQRVRPLQQTPRSTIQPTSTQQIGMQMSPEPKAADASKDDWARVGAAAAAEAYRQASPPTTAPAEAIGARVKQPVRGSVATPGKYGIPKTGKGASLATSEDIEPPLSVPTPASWHVEPSTGRCAMASPRPAGTEPSTATAATSSNPFQQLGDKFRRRVEQTTPGRLPVPQSEPSLVDAPAATSDSSNKATSSKPSVQQQSTPSNNEDTATTPRHIQSTLGQPRPEDLQTEDTPATPLIDVSTPQMDRSLRPKPPPGGLAEDSSTFFGGVGRAMAAFKENQKAPARATNNFPNQEHVDYFAAYPKPEKREGPPAGPRRVKLGNLPRNFTARNVADVVFGGQVERIEYSKGDSFAKVTFLEAEAAKAYFDDTANGLSIASHPGLIIMVGLDPQVMPATAATKMCLEKSISRVVRAIGVDKKLSIEDIKTRARKSESKDVSVEHLTVKQLASGVTAVEFRMCSIQGAVYLARSLRSDPEWEQCNVQYVPDPCATAKGPRTSS